MKHQRPVVPPPPSPELLETTRLRAHPRCLLCDAAGPLGLGQEFILQADGSVQSTFEGGEAFEGYVGLLHGGVTAALLDGAMTNCLFARGVRGLTAELTVRFREPVETKGRMTVRARLAESHGRLHLLRAELRQGGRLKAAAVGKFLESHG